MRISSSFSSSARQVRASSRSASWSAASRASPSGPAPGIWPWLSAWLLIHTVFAFHYARRYHAARRPAHSQPAELVFPGGHAPDYLDFCYFSFVVGMTSQVSDVAVSSRRMRRLTLTHSVLAFVFNIAILALSLNIIASAI